MSSDRDDGAPTIEEVLASIRRIIAGSVDDAAATLPPPMIREPARVLQDDFELPAMFRARRHELTAQSAHLMAGRRDREDRFLSSNSEKWRSAARQAQAAEAELSALAYARTTGREEQSSSIDDPASNGDVASAPLSQPLLHDIPRQMIPCKDTTIARMRRPLSKSEENTEPCKAPPEKGVVTSPEPIDAAELIGQDPSAIVSGEEGDAEIGKMVTNHLHQTAVELLRPVLIQWFETNARPIFEEALRAEIGSTKER